MAKVTSIECDDCHHLFREDQITRVTHTYRGPIVNGTMTEDLCANCLDVPEGVTLRPLRRQRQQAASPPAAAEPTEA